MSSKVYPFLKCSKWLSIVIKLVKFFEEFFNSVAMVIKIIMAF
jgi:hypothetical protein|nr:MAG TPA: hypothetical protein [Caudoviricetes sp.]DAN26672.1 MAG TPA: hypothetical protein [Caudoviricetes sp.]DAS40361.1 MAG TPA: hypothetical protein [Caudoviricetes sp.]